MIVAALRTMILHVRVELSHTILTSQPHLHLCYLPPQTSPSRKTLHLVSLPTNTHRIWQVPGTGFELFLEHFRFCQDPRPTTNRSVWPLLQYLTRRFALAARLPRKRFSESYIITTSLLRSTLDIGFRSSLLPLLSISST